MTKTFPTEPFFLDNPVYPTHVILTCVTVCINIRVHCYACNNVIHFEHNMCGAACHDNMRACHNECIHSIVTCFFLVHETSRAEGFKGHGNIMPSVSRGPQLGPHYAERRSPLGYR